MNDRTRKELIWMAGVLAILIGAAIGNVIYISMHNENFAQNVNANPSYPSNATIIKVDATQWSWAFIYSNGSETVNMLNVTVGKPVVLVVTSIKGAEAFAVIHDLSIPKLGVQVYAIPGQNNSLSFTPTVVGSYYFECVEYCGLDHYEMRGMMNVVA
jgi:cytochrome c oxidase subunit 2